VTRGQYIALLLIGAVAALAYLQSYEVARYLRSSGLMPARPKEFTA
jgi:hypothetical protein